MLVIKEALNVLCFGDSLTAGWYMSGPEWHPYAIALVDSLQKSFPSVKVTADVHGLPGDRVVSPPGGYLPRMDILYEEAQNPYDWAIILGGTNDLATWGKSDDIWEGLQKVYDIPLSHNTKVLALSVLDCGDCDPLQEADRLKLNSLIMTHEADNFYKFDLFTAFPWHNITDERRREIWEDGVHPNNVGYDIIGKLLADRLIELIEQDKDTTAVPVQAPSRYDLRRRRGSRQ